MTPRPSRRFTRVRVSRLRDALGDVEPEPRLYDGCRRSRLRGGDGVLEGLQKRPTRERPEVATPKPGGVIVVGEDATASDLLAAGVPLHPAGHRDSCIARLPEQRR